jgi:hypothetical protein
MKLSIFSLCILLVGPASESHARAEVAQNLEADYSARFAGFLVGQVHVTGAVTPTSYWVRIVGDYNALGFRGDFEGRVTGLVVGGTRFSPSAYQSSSTYQSPFSGRRTRLASVLFENGKIAHYAIEPPLTPTEESHRVPLGDPRQEGVVDPITAIVAQVVRSSVSRDGCSGKGRLFSGLSRFDIKAIPGLPGGSGEDTCYLEYNPVGGQVRGASVRTVTVSLPTGNPGSLSLPARLEVPFPIGTISIDRTR